jgi:hypothetical protein
MRLHVNPLRSEDFTAVTMRMPSSGMLLHVVLVRTDVSKERMASIIRVTRIGELRTMLEVTSNRSTLRRITTSVASYC